MKKIGILTFHDGKNFGASLQCYALKMTLEKIFFEDKIEVINFKKERVYGNKNKISVNYIARKLYGFLYRRSINESNLKFEDFLKKNLNINTEEIVTEENIGEKSHKYDVIFFGSDQIWNMNPKIYDRSHVFFGEFDYDGKKYSYAASFGDNIEYAEKNKEYILEKLKKFEKISVRESDGNLFLNNNNILSEQVVDPTLLLDEKQWNKLITKERIIKDKYILYYSVNCRKYSWQIAQRLSKLVGIKVINIVPHPKILMSGFKNYFYAGPLEFLNLIKNAEYVVTNSFHGTIFSIIFKKKFIPVFEEIDGKIKIEKRKYSLLEAIGMTDLAKTISSDIAKINFDFVYTAKRDENLNKIIDNSKKYLIKIKESMND